MCYKDSYKKIQNNFRYLTVFEIKQKYVHMCNFFFTYAKFLKKKVVFSEFFFATGLVFERFLASQSRFFEKVNGLGVLGIMRKRLVRKTFDMIQDLADRMNKEYLKVSGADELSSVEF
ncbi:hypothetical protein LXL04_030226 [Taraxacum kok-saghyz]